MTTHLLGCRSNHYNDHGTAQGGFYEKIRVTNRVEFCGRCRCTRPGLHSITAVAAEFTMKFGTATFNESQHQYIKFKRTAPNFRSTAAALTYFGWFAAVCGASRLRDTAM